MLLPSRWELHDDYDWNIGLFGKIVYKPVQVRSVNVMLPQNFRKAIELNQTKCESFKSMLDRLINQPLHIPVLNTRLASGGAPIANGRLIGKPGH